MIFRGRVWKFGNDVDTDVIIPIQYTNTTDMEEFGRHCMEGIDPDFHNKVSPGDIIVTGKNFGCGSSREPAPLAIKALGISCIIAESYARIFYRNAFNVGLPLLECADGPRCIEERHEIEVDLDSGEIWDVDLEKSFKANRIPPFMQRLIQDGGLMNHVAKELNSRGYQKCECRR